MPSGLRSAALAACLGMLACLAGCAASSGAPAASPACAAGTPECPVQLTLEESAGGRTQQVEGSLSAQRPGISYRVCTATPAQLQWEMHGPPANVILQSPDGSVDGPRIGKSVALPVAGCYVLGLSANLRADSPNGPYGPFRLTVSIQPYLEGER